MGFVEGFQRYMATRTDCPPDFHIHAALVTLATSLGNRVWCHGWTRPIYPNLWAVIIAPSGYGKSTSLDMADHLLRKAQVGDRLLPNSFSYEALLATLKTQPVGTFLLQEFSSFLGMLSRDYNAGVVPLLTEVYDCPPALKRVTMKGDIIIEQPCLSILGASSPTWFAEQFKGGKDLEGGFLARFIFCPSTDAGPPVDDPGPPDDATETVLAAHLRAAMALSGPADFKAVQGTFNAWDREYRRERVRRNCPPEFSGMRARAGLMVKKTAILFRISRSPDGINIGPNDLQAAIDYVTYSHNLAEDFLQNEVARDSDEADRLKLVSRLREHDGRARWSELLRTSHMRADKFARAIDTLKQGGRVGVEDLRDSQRGPRTRWVVLISLNGSEPE